MKRIGIFGGSFDPVHNAHVALAQLALTQLRLDQLRWVPAGQAWQKARQLADAVHREAMVRLAMEGAARFTLERCELLRPGPSYTLDTVRELQAGLPGGLWFLIIGQDQYQSLHTWRDWQQLLGLVTLAVANRPGPAAPANPQVQRVGHRAVALPMMDVSSTDIRQRIATGQRIADLVPAAVARYIERHQLYRAQPRS